MLTARYITADWCGPCKSYKPVATRVFAEAGVPLEFVDVEDLGEGESVYSVPTILFSFGERIVGAYPENSLRKVLISIKDDYVSHLGG